ncbi:MAG: D-glycerate dehydrogenase [Acidobacteriota bacterium]
MKYKVLLTREIIKEAMDYLKAHAEVEVCWKKRAPEKREIIQKIKDKQGLLCLLTDRIDREIIDSAPQLKIISNCAVGYNNIDYHYAISKRIWVTNTPGILTETTADLTWALILSVARMIPEADKFTRKKRFKGWDPLLFLGKDVYGKTIGIIGLGRIGKAVAKRATGFSMKVLYWDKIKLQNKEEKSIGVRFEELENLLKEADIITIHVPLNEQTFHLMSRERIYMMKKGAILINTSRGEVIDEKSLADALEDGHLWGAGLDVYEKEPEVYDKLLKLNKVVLLPHIGSATYETRLKMSMMAAKNLAMGLEGKIPENLIDEWKTVSS